MSTPARRFRLVRDVDETGISGTGIVALGVQFPDGPCVLRWQTEHRSTCSYDSIGDVEKIHGHGGKTRIEWLDPMPGYPEGDDLIGYCILCTGGGVDDGPSVWCIGCGARHSVVMLPRWVVHDLRQQRDRRRSAKT